MKKIKLSFALIWHCFMASVSPIIIGFIYMFITCHGKGYGYDLRGEADIYIMIGLVALFFWLAATIPVAVWLSRTFYRIKKMLFWVPILSFFLFFIIGVILIGWQNFISMFGI